MDETTEGISQLDRIAAEKSNKELGHSKGLLSSEKVGTSILDKYEESERNRDNSFKDPLTQLLNRRGLFEEYKLEESTRKRAGLEGKNVLIAMDLIGMKRMNAELSMEGADQVLMKMASTMKQQIRETDLAGRWGGDEFLLVLFGANEETAKNTIQEIIDNSPDGVQYNIGYQIIDQGGNPESLMKGIMSKLDYIKTLGLTDETGRATGEGVVVNVDNI